MYCVEIFWPLAKNAASRDELPKLRRTLTERFGGVTAFTRAPARGMWRDDDGKAEADDIVIIETMVEELDRDYWRALKSELERNLHQDDVLIRAYEVERL